MGPDDPAAPTVLAVHGLYSPGEIKRWKSELPTVTIRKVPDVNHHTIVLGEAGASAVAREIRRHQPL